MGCVSQDSYPRKSVLAREGKLGSKHAVKFSKGTWHQMKIRERKGPSQGIIQKWEPHGRGLCAPKFGERSHEETITCKTDNFVHFVVPRLSTSSGSNSSSTSALQDLSSTSPAQERSDGLAPGDWCGSPSKKPKCDTIEIRTTVCEIFLNCWQSSQMI